MAVEARRACGYRKTGGLYLVGEGHGVPCCKLPIMLGICPSCGGGIKQTRGWTWIDPRPWLKGPCADEYRINCPAACAEALGERVGLLWIGAQFYPTPQAFQAEAQAMGVSRRIIAVPRKFKVGETWMFFAHPKVKLVFDATNGSEGKWLPGIFRMFMPSRIEKIITQTMSEDAELMADLAQRNITPVIVPDDDKDHQGSVYDGDAADLPLFDEHAA
jgi:hypothetical protein